jgi:MFS family permease
MARPPGIPKGAKQLNLLESEVHVSDSSPLLHSTEVNPDAPNTPVPSQGRGSLPVAQKNRILMLLCAFAFVMTLGENLQPAALVQIFEAVICADYYYKHPLLPNTTATPTTLSRIDRCAVQPVQKELAILRGFQQLVPLFAGLLCTIPYSLLAERIGRKRVLILAGAGISAALFWVIAVCYWRFVPIRWVLLSGIFLFIGGGDGVLSAITHVMVTDATDRAEGAQIFLYLHAADVISGFFGPAISGLLMEKGYIWTVLILAELVVLSGAFVLTLFIPETLDLGCKSPHDAHLTLGSTSIEGTQQSLRSSKSTSFTGLLNGIRVQISILVAPLIDVLASNRQALLLLCIFAPQTAARELFTVIGLQYSKAKFSLSYAHGNVLLSVFQGAQGLSVLVFLPMITRLIAEPRGWSPWTRDRRYAIFSIAMIALGLMIIALAPVLIVEAIALLIIATGGCTTGLLLSLLGGTVTSRQVSAVYSAALMLSLIIRSVTGPIFSALLTKGFSLGQSWMGLPFAAMSMIVVGVVALSCFIKKEGKEVAGLEF